MKIAEFIFIIILCFIVIFGYLLLEVGYRKIQLKRIKKGKNLLKIKTIFDIRIALLIIIILILNTSNLFNFFYYSTFPNFEVEVGDNINNIDFNKLIIEIEKKIGSKEMYIEFSDDYFCFEVDDNGKIEKLYIYFAVPRFGNSIYYIGEYENKIIKFNKFTGFKYDYTDNELKTTLIKSFELLASLNYTSLINESKKYIENYGEVNKYKFEINFYFNSNNQYRYNNPNHHNKNFTKKLILEESGKFNDYYGNPDKDFFGAIKIYHYKLGDNDYYPTILVYKNV